MRKFFTRPLTIIVLVVLLICLLSILLRPSREPEPAPTSDLPGEKAALDGVSHMVGKDLNPARLAEGLVPPTNRWFSGLVFGAEPLPVYPLPLSFQLTSAGFTFGLPDVQATANTLTGGHKADVTVTIPNIQGWRVVAYDTATVTVEAYDSSGAIGRVVLAQGSPQITFTASQSVSLNYGKLAENFALATSGLDQTSQVQLETGQHATWLAIPDGASVEDLVAQTHPITSSSLEWRADDQEVSTTIGWQTDDGSPALVAAMPHQLTEENSADCQLGTYDSVYGQLPLCSTRALTWTAPAVDAPATYPVEKLNDEAKADLSTQLEQDVAGLADYPADTYFGGKALARDAQLLHLATSLGRDDLAQQLRDRLVPELLTWTNPGGCGSPDAARCFFYDVTNRGMVGQVPSFGSEQYNDHHFHYGYFLYAAALVVMDDPELKDRVSPIITLLVSDIARPSASNAFPQLRVYDAWASHSWASGVSPFADANNQESTSEAVAAWMGLRLWAGVVDDTALADQAAWMHASEADAALAYWLNFDMNDPLYAPLEHSYLPLNFGGKRDFATWFSAEPEAGLAIQVLPVTPGSTYLGVDQERVATNVEEALTADTFDRTYGDLLLAYYALSSPEARAEALELAREVPIDDGFARSLLLAWLYTLDP